MAAGSTYTPIATTTLGSAQSSITFSSFSGYTDVVIVIEGVTTASSNNHFVRFNSDTGTNYSVTNLRGNGTSAISGRRSTQSSIFITESSPDTGRFVQRIMVMNYANSTTYKTQITRSDTAAFATETTVGLWRNTAAITSITVTAGASTYVAGTTATIYGIQAA